MNISKIYKLVESSKLSNRELAKVCNISTTTLYNLLNGLDVKVSTIEALASALGVNPATFFDGDSTIVVGGGNNSATSMNGNATVGTDTERVKYLERLLEEKERTIQILLKQQAV